MKITFNINYRTSWGESLYIYGDIAELGNGDDHAARQMNLINSDTWEFTVETDKCPEEFTYRYVVKAKDAAWRFEWGAPHRFVPGKNVTAYNIFDHWQDMPGDKPYFSSAFVDGMLHRTHVDMPLNTQPGTLNLRVWAPMIGPDQVLAVSGECEALGKWEPKRAIRFNDSHYPEWEISLNLDKLEFPCEYKFLILNKATSDIVAWEARNNRVLNVNGAGKKDSVVVSGLRFVNPLGPWKGAGTAIPTFSVRTEEDFGVGDFLSLKKMIDWCKLTGQKILQLLPINDTTMTGKWVDSYPYNANSTFALHPMYIRLEAVGKPKDKKKRDSYEALRQELNSLPEVDYERVNDAKISYLRDVYADKKSLLGKDSEYKEFVERNIEWLKPYAAFCVLRDINGTPDMLRWGEYAVYEEAKIEQFCNEHKEDIEFIYFVQFHLDRQIRDVRNYAHLQGIVLKGDIPIGISRTSVDAWVYPRLFNMDCQAGAPPDDFSVLGQNWGFPTYNWEEMAKDGFAWWKARFRKMSEYFDAYRIDHVLGFFRIWQIPMNALHGLLGIFNPAMPFTPDELRNNYDFWINPDVQAHPFIMEWLLTDFFGEYTNEVKERFLEPIGDGRYRLKEFVDTQIKVSEYFATQEKNEKNERISNALMGLIDDVLFIEDPYEKGKYHPRISAHFTYQYRNLTDYEKWCFNRLYNDFFYRRHNDFWYGKAMWKLPPLLDSTSMLTCAEDLGMIPDCVPAVMHNLQILSLEIQRMPKDSKVEFANTWAYPYYSVCTTSTHDMSGIRAWWESDHAMSQRYYNQVLHEGGDAPYFAEPWICERIVRMQLDSPSMLCILPLQDWLATDGGLRRENPQEEQINIPSISRHYWRYRMHLTVEELMRQDKFNTCVREMIAESNR